MSKVKIFVLYHKQSPIFKTDVLEPIQTGADDATEDLGILKDNTGDNISKKNKNYAELSAWYWVWKNYLPAHPEVEYIGFCHYRRFLDFTRKPSRGQPFTECLFRIFAKKFTNYTDDKVYDFVRSFDVILPSKYAVRGKSIYERYSHPRDDLDALIKIVTEEHPQYVRVMNRFFASNKMYSCLNFVMTRKLFAELADWLFPILSELENQRNWSSYTDYNSLRTPAYLAERFFNVWLAQRATASDLKIAHRKSYLLMEKINYRQRIKRIIAKLIARNGRREILGYEFINE